MITVLTLSHLGKVSEWWNFARLATSLSEFHCLRQAREVVEFQHATTRGAAVVWTTKRALSLSVSFRTGDFRCGALQRWCDSTTRSSPVDEPHHRAQAGAAPRRPRHNIAQRARPSARHPPWRPEPATCARHAQAAGYYVPRATSIPASMPAPAGALMSRSCICRATMHTARRLFGWPLLPLSNRL